MRHLGGRTFPNCYGALAPGWEKKCSQHHKHLLFCGKEQFTRKEKNPQTFGEIVQISFVGIIGAIWFKYLRC